MTAIKGTYIKTIEDSVKIDQWKHIEVSMKHLVASCITEEEIKDAEGDMEEIRNATFCRVGNSILAIIYSPYIDALVVFLVMKQGDKLEYISHDPEPVLQNTQSDAMMVGGVFSYTKIGENKYKVVTYCY